jgi:hypothetical protein
VGAVIHLYLLWNFQSLLLLVFGWFRWRDQAIQAVKSKDKSGFPNVALPWLDIPTYSFFQGCQR